jgi:hypothetical protein
MSTTRCVSGKTNFVLPVLFVAILVASIVGVSKGHAQTLPFDVLTTFQPTTTAGNTTIPIVCHTIYGTGVVPSKFASPVNFFSLVQEPLITAGCQGRKSVLIEVGNGDNTQYIYKYGYRKVDGVWKKITYSGTRTVGAWVVGKATVQVEGVQEGIVGEVIAYICQKVGNSWKCGCTDKVCSAPKWQLQKYELTKEVYTGAKAFNTNMQSNFLGDISVLDVYKSSKNIGSVGSTIELTGAAFSKSNKNDILWNGQVKETGLVSKDGFSLLITVPNLPPAKYEVTVRVGDVESEYGATIWVRTPGQVVAPVIKSISPEVGTQGGTFTIYGEGFTNNNDVVTTFGLLEGLPSKDGKSITFMYDPFEEKLESWVKPGVRYHYKQQITVKVANTSGISNVGVFSLDI